MIVEKPMAEDTQTKDRVGRAFPQQRCQCLRQLKRIAPHQRRYDAFFVITQVRHPRHLVRAAQLIKSFLSDLMGDASRQQLLSASEECALLHLSWIIAEELLVDFGVKSGRSCNDDTTRHNDVRNQPSRCINQIAPIREMVCPNRD